jgi:hypothetical protein
MILVLPRDLQNFSRYPTGFGWICGKILTINRYASKIFGESVLENSSMGNMNKSV